MEAITALCPLLKEAEFNCFQRLGTTSEGCSDFISPVQLRSLLSTPNSCWANVSNILGLFFILLRTTDIDRVCSFFLDWEHQICTSSDWLPPRHSRWSRRRPTPQTDTLCLRRCRPSCRSAAEQTTRKSRHSALHFDSNRQFRWIRWTRPSCGSGRLRQSVPASTQRTGDNGHLPRLLVASIRVSPSKSDWTEFILLPHWSSIR